MRWPNNNPPGKRRPALLALLISLAFLALAVASSRADRIQLRGGGEIHGAVRIDSDRPDLLLIQTMSGSSPIPFPKSDITNIIEEEDPLDEYDQRVAALPETAEAHYELALWCEENRMQGLAETHYRRVVELDKDFGPAHKKLGHVQHRGEWVTYDQMRTAQGMVRYEGQWIPQEEVARIESQRAGQAELEAQVRQVRVLRQGLTASTAGQPSAEERLFAFAEPATVPALVRALAEDPEPYVRSLLIRLLASVDGPEATRALLGRALEDPDAAIRRGAVAELAKRDRAEIEAYLTRLLGSNDQRALGRVAQTLAGIGAKSAVPRLIDALVVVERRFAWVPTVQPAAAQAPMPTLDITGRSFPILTGPTVGQGVVAYGATSVPYGPGAGLSMGTRQSVQGPPVPRMVTRVHRNPDVLAALESLTGRNFGYDKQSWKLWLARVSRANPDEPARQIPQP